MDQEALLAILENLPEPEGVLDPEKVVDVLESLMLKVESMSQDRTKFTEEQSEFYLAGAAGIVVAFTFALALGKMHS